MTQDEAKSLFKELYPCIWNESIFATPIPGSNIDALTVLNAIRKRAKPPMSEEEVNAFLDELESTKKGPTP